MAMRLFSGTIRRGGEWLAALMIAATHCSVVRGQEAQNDSSPSEPSQVVARVAGEAITVGQWEAAVERQIRPGAGAADRQAVRQRVLQELIDQLRILHWLEQRNQAAGEEEVQREQERLRGELAQRGWQWEAFWKQHGLAASDVTRQLRWQLSWRKLLDRYLTDENLQRYFEKHRREFDGSRVRVAHILFPAQPGNEAAQRAARQQAIALRERLVAGELPFAVAAGQVSRAPTSEQGGQLGWIARSYPMPEPFTQAAFALDAGEISPPVTTHFGVHLIHCLEWEQGQKQWHDVRNELEEALSAFLLGWAAEQARSVAKVELVPGPSTGTPSAELPASAPRPATP